MWLPWIESLSLEVSCTKMEENSSALLAMWFWIMFASLPSVTTSSQRLIPKGRQNLKSRTWERSSGLWLHRFSATVLRRQRKPVLSRTSWKCAWKPTSHLRRLITQQSALSCLATWRMEAPYPSQTSCGERTCLMDTRTRTSSLTHKIVDKEVTTSVIKINNVEY